MDLNIHALTSRDMMIGGQGYAGAGKTFFLATFREIIESRGNTVKGVAYTGKAADGIETEAKIKSSTIARDSRQPRHADWIIVDEASMAGSRDLHGILKRAKAEGSRVLLIGDTEQLQAISAGRIFKDLIQHGMTTVEMKQIVRQKDGTYKEIVRSIIEKRIDEAFDKLSNSGLLHEIKDRNERLAAIARDYTNRPDWRKSVVISAKNADTHELNNVIRATLQKRGKIDQQDHEMTIRTQVSMQPAQERFAQSYEVGQYVFARRAGVGGMKAGAEARIIEIDHEKHTLLVKGSDDTNRTIDLVRDGNKISTYEERQDRFSEREKIIFTKNDSKLKVRNGQTGEILKIEDSGLMIIAMQDGSTRHVDPATYQYVNHGDAVTTYKAQGMSQHNVIVNAPADSLQTYNAMYVQATRGKFDLQVYTDSREKLIERVKIEQEKKSTLESKTEGKQETREPERSIVRDREIELEM
jgi:ATP-dependent exoDNAse (exonuclease V) alpha subunit